jgi:hypothetical protein
MIGVTKIRLGQGLATLDHTVPTGQFLYGTLFQALCARLRSVSSLRDALADISQSSYFPILQLLNSCNSCNSFFSRFIDASAFHLRPLP